MTIPSRIKTCYRCEYDTSSVEGDLCPECGCLLDIEAAAQYKAERRLRRFLFMSPFLTVFLVAAGIGGAPDRLSRTIEQWMDFRLATSVPGFVCGVVLVTALLWGVLRPRWIAILPALVLGPLAYVACVALSWEIVDITCHHVVH